MTQNSQIKKAVIPFLIIFIVIVGTIAIFALVELATNPESRSDSSRIIPASVLWSILIGLIFLLLKLFKKWNLGKESWP